MGKINLKYAVWKEDKYYIAQCLNVEVSSFGNTRKEALNNLQEAVELYFKKSPPEINTFSWLTKAKCYHT